MSPQDIVSSVVSAWRARDSMRPQLRTVLLLIVGVVILGLVWRTVQRAHDRDDAVRERHIDSLSAFSAHAKALLAVKRRENDRQTRVALQSSGAYHGARDRVTIDLVAATLTSIGMTSQAVPPVALNLIVHCDSAIAQLERALAGSRELTALAVARADSIELASELKDERPGPQRCGAKCGAVLAVVTLKVLPPIAKALFRRAFPPASLTLP